jgi:hypothetical protein
MCCDGTICWNSYESATMAIQAGWKNVYWFRVGDSRNGKKPGCGLK